MKESKFSLNRILVIVIIFSAIAFLVMVKLVNTSSFRVPVNDFYPIEDTELAIKYSSLQKSGIYKGDENTGELVLEGTFGYDWGLAVEGDSLYLNEIKMTDIGFVVTELVKVDMNTFEKQVVLKDALLRGKCKSGELVCFVNYTMPSNKPETNALCTLYNMYSDSVTPPGEVTVAFLDAENGQIVYTEKQKEMKDSIFNAKYINRTLSEVQG
jgi:hypothetical protein